MTKIQRTFRFILAGLFLASSSVHGEPADGQLSSLPAFKKLSNTDELSELAAKKAFESAVKQYNDEKSLVNKAKMAFALGVFSYKSGEKTKAAEYLNAALQFKTHLDDYVHFYLGQIERDNKDFKGARQHFESVRTHQPSSIREAEAEIELAKMARDDGHWREAHSLLIHLERKHRHDPQYQDILYNLIEASLNFKSGSDACRAAVRLFSKYPTYTLTKGWGINLARVTVGKYNLRCPIGNRERDKRLMNLIIAGEFDEVRSEIKDWLTLIRAENKPHPEELGKIELEQGQLSLAEGKVKEAITHFQTAQDIMGRNFSAQMLLAKAYSQTDDYPSAVEGYVRAYDLSPKSKLGQKALFQAAFLSYQNRDYDGASRRFEDVVKKGRGPLVWDAKWHLAWIRYLKSDYEGARKEFLELAKNKHYLKSVDQEKLQYWRAMAEFRDSNIEEARTLFKDLAAKNRMGYYTAAAQARLAVLPAPKSGAEIKAVPTLTPTTTPVLPATSVSPSAAPAPAAPSTSPSPAPSGSPAATTAKVEISERHIASTEESLGGEKDALKAEEGKDEDDAESPPVTSEGVNENAADAAAEKPNITPLKNPSLVARFERAQDLIDIGFDAWAVMELREIERRTSNHGYLMSLMGEYLKAGDFFRSAFIADVIFETEREKNGIDGANLLWDYAFPQAFTKSVGTSSKKFDVASELVWSIMRGESGFREDIHSSAGALGLMQLIPPTAKKIAKSLGFPEYKNAMLLVPDINIQFGTRYLKRLSKTMANNLALVIASYNAGPHRVQGWLHDFGDLDMDEFIEHIPYMETRNYVKKVLRNYFVYLELYQNKPANPLKWLSAKPTIKFTGPKPTSESWEDFQ